MDIVPFKKKLLWILSDKLTPISRAKKKTMCIELHNKNQITVTEEHNKIVADKHVAKSLSLIRSIIEGFYIE